MRPEDVGVPSTTLVLGKHSGRHAVQKRCEQLGVGADAVRGGPRLPPDGQLRGRAQARERCPAAGHRRRGDGRRGGRGRASADAGARRADARHVPDRLRHGV
ncbi:MAG: hypothetical protein MZV64_43410 [Ignavibacteriales bacterium]|nr:hypothetical protein [Ignavibacteriales bacterium]